MSPNVVASVRARLLSQAREHGEEFERTLARYAAERLLYRLGASAARERCILKGASLLAVWLPEPYRATRDVDLLLSGNSDDLTIRSLLETICAVPCPEDALQFDLSGVVIEVIRPEDENSGKRARFRAFLGHARIAVQLDLGVGDALNAPPDEIQYPTMLETVPAPRLRAYPREAAVAEKFEAMVKLGTRNSRMKDFHDLWALSEGFDFEGSALRGAVAACFERRGTRWTQEVPGVLTKAFYQAPTLAERWRNYRNGTAVLVAPPELFEEIGERLITFLEPVRESILRGEPYPRTWTKAGAWR